MLYNTHIVVACTHFKIVKKCSAKEWAGKEFDGTELYRPSWRGFTVSLKEAKRGP